MAEWIGHLLVSVPQWSFLPLLILVIILCALGWWIWAMVDAMSYSVHGWPFKAKRVDLGEKKNAKK